MNNMFLLTVAEMTTEASYAFAAAIAILVGIGAAIAMGMAVYKALESIARQPEAADKIRTVLLLGLAFIETTVIYALFIAIMIVIKIL